MNYIQLRKLIAKIRVRWWAFRHPEDVMLFHCLDSAHCWFKAEDAKVDSDGKIRKWIDHRKVKPDWYKEIIGEKLIKELEILSRE